MMQCFSGDVSSSENQTIEELEQLIGQVETCIRASHKVLIFLRGVPGSGKSHLARLVSFCVDLTHGY